MPTLLTPAIIDFMESGEVSLYVAACSAQLRPRATRAFGCRVCPQTSTVTTWVSRPAAPALLDDISSNGRLALVVSHIETCKTFQLKAVDAEVALLDAADHARVAAYHDAFIEQAMEIGYPEPMLRSMMQYRLDQIAAIVFTASAVFAQTPGPGAGAPVASEPVQ
jgi:hypothetical protein